MKRTAWIALQRLSGTLQCMELAASGGTETAKVETKLRIKKQVRLRIPPLIDTSAGGELHSGARTDGRPNAKALKGA